MTTSTKQPVSYAENLSRFIAEVEYDDLPASTVAFTKDLTAKIVAAIVGGSRSVPARRLEGIIRERAGAEEATAIGFGFRTSLWDAVLLNIFSSHTSELEDVGHSPAGVSWDITIIPTAISLGEKLHLTGRQLIETIATGLEVHYRTCMPFDLTSAGFILPPTAAMGCAAAASKACGASAGEIRNALGMALSCVTMTDVNMGTDAHFLESAMHGLQGVIAADMAGAGLTGNPDIGSFSELVTDDVPLELVTDGLMDRWYFEEIWIKKYPLCFLVHRQVDILLDILDSENLAYEDVERVEVLTGPGEASCDRPDVQTVGDLQFSFQHALGVAMIKRGVGLEDVEIEAATDPRFAEARNKVSVEIDETLAYSVSLAEPTSVTVITRDGRTFTDQRLAIKGSPAAPLERDELTALYHQYAGGVLDRDSLVHSLDLIWNLEELDDVSRLVEAIDRGSESLGMKK